MQACAETEEKDRIAKTSATTVITQVTGKSYIGRMNAKKKIAEASAIDVEPKDTSKGTAKLLARARQDFLPKTEARSLKKKNLVLIVLIKNLLNSIQYLVLKNMKLRLVNSFFLFFISIIFSILFVLSLYKNSLTYQIFNIK